MRHSGCRRCTVQTSVTRRRRSCVEASRTTVNVEKAAKHVLAGFGAKYHHSIAPHQPSGAAQAVESNPNRRATQITEYGSLADHFFRRQLEPLRDVLRHSTIGRMR